MNKQHSVDEILSCVSGKHLSFVRDNLIFLVLSGSHAYGMATAESDYDYRGICVPPVNSYFTTSMDRFNQAEDKKNDVTIYGIVRYFQLAAQVNPNIVELLFVDPSVIVYKHPIMDIILENRHLFLSKKAAHTFSGYAMAQLKRIVNHKRWLDNPLKEPDRKDYDLPATARVGKEKLKALATLGSEFLNESFNKGTTEYILNEIRYHNDAKEYSRYRDWVTNRNPKRAELERKCGYDCYLGNTEFLTKDGWKSFFDVDEDCLLATYNKETGSLEYQKYVDRYYSDFNGDIYTLSGNRHECHITPNHNMLIRKKERRSKKTGELILNKASLLPDTFEVVNTIEPKKRSLKNISIGIDKIELSDYLRVMGLFLADGTINFRGSEPKNIRISQVKPIINNILSKMKNRGITSISHYKNKRTTSYSDKEIIENIWCFNSKELTNKIYSDCGHGSKNKRIPRWVFDLSKRMMSKLLISMLRGDGTKRKSGVFVYYTNNKNLANDVNELAFLCGFQTWVLGEYADGMYQVHIDFNPKKHSTFIRSRNISKKYVEDARIVCFTVPNETLVTRYNGYVSIHGNSKHASHLVRLLRMAKEIATTGTLHTNRPDKEFLMDIRNGKYSYEYIVEYAEQEEEEVRRLFDESNLPYTVDYIKIDNLLLDVFEKYYNINLRLG